MTNNAATKNKQQRIVGFCGPKRAGKSTAGLILDRGDNPWAKHEMSDTMRSIVEDAIGFKMTDAYYEQTKDTQMVLESISKATFRDFYIAIGQGLRKYVSPNIHSNIFKERIEEASLNDKDIYTPSIRFDAEARMINEAGGIIIEIVRDGYSYNRVDPTERGIYRNHITYCVRNNGNKSDLWSSVMETIEYHYG